MAALDDDVHAARPQDGPLAGVPWDLLLRALDSAPGRTSDRLVALDQLRAWIDQQEHHVIVTARRDGLTWADIGAAAGGLSRRAAHHRWGPVVARLEPDGLLRAPPPAGPPAQPHDPLWATTPGVTWCRWCGHRLGMPGDAGAWVHCRPVAGDRRLAQAEDLDTSCRGPEPWPAQEPWPDGPPASRSAPTHHPHHPVPQAPPPPRPAVAHPPSRRALFT